MTKKNMLEKAREYFEKVEAQDSGNPALLARLANGIAFAEQLERIANAMWHNIEHPAVTKIYGGDI